MKELIKLLSTFTSKPLTEYVETSAEGVQTLKEGAAAKITKLLQDDVNNKITVKVDAAVLTAKAAAKAEFEKTNTGLKESDVVEYIKSSQAIKFESTDYKKAIALAVANAKTKTAASEETIKASDTFKNEVAKLKNEIKDKEAENKILKDAKRQQSLEALQNAQLLSLVNSEKSEIAFPQNTESKPKAFDKALHNTKVLFGAAVKAKPFELKVVDGALQVFKKDSNELYQDENHNPITAAKVYQDFLISEYGLKEAQKGKGAKDTKTGAAAKTKEAKDNSTDFNFKTLEEASNYMNDLNKFEKLDSKQRTEFYEVMEELSKSAEA